MPLSQQEFDALRKITSPSVANAIETFNVRPRREGFMSSEIRALFPELGPVVGYAVTAVIRAEQAPQEGHREARRSPPRRPARGDLDSPQIGRASCRERV